LYTDPDGELVWFIPVLISIGKAALIGGAIGGGMYTISKMTTWAFSGEKLGWNWGDFGKSVGAGALSGSFSGIAANFGVNGFNYVFDKPLVWNSTLAVKAAKWSTLVTAGGSWASGLVENWDEGAKRFDNWGDIWKGMAQGNPWQVTSRFTWELPQTIIGVGGANIMNMTKQIDVSYYENATVIEGGGFGGKSAGIGHTIFLAPGSTVQSQLFLHEYGHYRQSQFFGPLYSVLALASGINMVLHPDKHDKFWVERLANDYARNKFGNRYGSVWGTTNYPLWTWKMKNWW
jgi:hypothetical protein